MKGFSQGETKDQILYFYVLPIIICTIKNFIYLAMSAASHAMKSMKGASIDMTEVVPMPVDSLLLKLYNITVTPHVTGYTLESQQDPVP